MLNWKKLLIIIFVLGFVAVNGYVIFSKISPSSTPNSISHTSRLVAWGDNDFGQLGMDSDRALTKENPLASVLLDAPIKNIAAGINFSLAVTEAGEVYSWGSNTAGQLGIGTTARQLKPVRVENLPVITQVATSQFHALALDENGKVWAWGLNGSGQLGDGSYQDSSNPAQVQNISNIKKVGTGYRMSWALDNDGKVWVWGADCKNNGETEYQKFLKSFANSVDLQGTYFDIGISSITQENEAANCLGEQWINIMSPTPVVVPKLSDVADVSAGFGHFLILKNDGTVWSWGCNIYGQLGLGVAENTDAVKRPQQVMGLPHITAISAGFRHSLALDDQKKVWTWGRNHKGEAGTDVSEAVVTPQKMTTLPPIAQVSGGQEYSVALDQEGFIWGWGENGYTQLGIDGPLYTVTPNKLHENWKFSQIDAGGGHVLGLAEL